VVGLGVGAYVGDAVVGLGVGAYVGDNVVGGKVGAFVGGLVSSAGRPLVCTFVGEAVGYPLAHQGLAPFNNAISKQYDTINDNTIFVNEKAIVL
jgi:hypothetical protein